MQDKIVLKMSFVSFCLLQMRTFFLSADLKLLFRLNVLNGGVKNVRAVLISHQVLLQVVLGRPDKHHPVTSLLIGQVEPEILRSLALFLWV